MSKFNSNFDCITIPSHIFEKIHKSQGLIFNKISKLTPQKIVSDLLDQNRSLCQAEILNKYVNFEGKKVLEVGSGLGVNHIVWVKKYNIEGYGVEPEGTGFESSYKISKQLVAINGLDPDRILNAPGESLPFDENSFDIVYSSNVLEHVADPARVLDEALRVLRPGGILQFIYPNYHSYFDGHYAVFHPPIFFKGFLPWYVNFILRRDPQFAKTLRTELNVSWTRKQLTKLQEKYNIDVISLGQEIFLERMRSLNFETWAGLTKVKAILNIFRKLGLNFIAARIILLLNGWTPIILTIRKG